MKYTFRTFYCGSGDCIFLVLENGNCTLNIMVDCGKYTEEIDGFVRTELKNKIDYLIVTHIDNDHINGLVAMMTRNRDLMINHIIYILFDQLRLYRNSHKFFPNSNIGFHILLFYISGDVLEDNLLTMQQIPV